MGKVLLNFSRRPKLALAREAALAALAQDAARDATSSRCIGIRMHCSGRIVAKSNFVLCGIVEAGAIFASRKVRAAWKFREGQQVKNGSEVCRVSGRCRDVLACERTALDYLSLLSGIATRADAASEKYGRWKIAATRKTLPLLSHSEKRAVLLGGCLTHRLDLSDGILVKDNHIAAIMREKNVRKEEATRLALASFGPGRFVEIEVSSVRQAVAASKAGAKAILVDNVAPSLLKKIAKEVRRISGKIIIEASGGIRLKNAGRYLKAGADFVSSSELTMRTEPADLSLEID